MKIKVLIRVNLIWILLVFSTLRLSAQSSGSPNLEFVENKGQWDSQVKFRANTSTGAFYLSRSGFTVVQTDTADLAAFAGLTHHRPKQKGASGSLILHSHAYRMNFLNGNEGAEIIPDKPLQTYNNYFIGKDPSKWAGNCKIYQGVTYKNVYDGVDLRYYTEGGRLKYDLIVHPGADPNKIAMRYTGQSKLNLKKNQLQIKTTVGDVKEAIPQSYQVDETGRKDVNCRFVLSDDSTIRFKVTDYSPTATLVIDPSIVFCSFSGSSTDNWGFTATNGPDGSLYMAGIVSGSGFPVSPGAFQTTTTAGADPNSASNHWDVGVIKLSTNGATRVYATYLGGEANEYPHSLIVDKNGELIVLGRTYSSNFPLYPSGNQQGPGGNADIFVTKFNASGTGLIGSMKIGGTGADGVNIQDEGEVGLSTGGVEKLNSLIRNYGDWSRSEVILDGSNNVYVSACSQSSDFPMRGSGFQTTLKGAQDGVLLKLDPTCNQLLMSTFIGGSNVDAGVVLDINPLTNNLYIGGSTMSTDFPGVTSNAYQPGFRGTINGYVSIVSVNGSTATLVGSTYLSSPTSGTIDMVYGVKFDKLGYPYVMGTSTGNWPVVNAAYSNSGAKQYLVKLKPDLSGSIYSTVFGSTNASEPNISPVAFLVDRCQNVYISGWGGWYAAETDPYFLQGTEGMPITSDAIKSTTDNRDFYFIVLKRDASNILYGTFFGEKDDATSISEHVDGGTSRYDQNGIIYQGICANCYRGNQSVTSGPYAYIPFPTTSGVWAPHNNAGVNGCNLAGVKIAFNFSGVSAGLKAELSGRGDSLGCIPLDATLMDTVRNAKSYIWEFGDGTAPYATTNSTVSHTYTNVGVYTVTLIAIDSSSCNISDTATMHITAKNNPAYLNFDYSKANDDCHSMSYVFHNLSTHSPNAPDFTNTSFEWNFGDGSGTFVAGLPDFNHTYAAAGPYNVSLILTDTNYCNAPDTLIKPLYVTPLVKAQFTEPPFGCAPAYIQFNNTSIGGQQYYWDFGDGTIDTVDRTPPPHYYPNVGTYTIFLRVVDSTTCNIVDSVTETLTVYGKPTAGFSFAPDPPAPNTPDVFTNTSSEDAVLFKWIFGDGTWTMKSTADTVIHQFNVTDTFQVCLVAWNSHGCSDTACHPVPVLINPLLDVPNAFTPGRFGENAIVKVMGFGITRMVWKIYNRWGQLVFESTDPTIGWDGTYKGAVQPMDVYGYTLEAEFSDGKKVVRKGDITLIR